LDNLTHSLAGAITVELCSRWLPGPLAPSRRRALFVVAVVANNVPDLDFAYTFVTGGKLGYLLHHRGHTHTLLVAFGLAALVAAFGLWWSRRWQDERASVDRRWLVAFAFVGTWLHIAMDFGNNYGVHPFWPWNDRWYYGDTIFIIEPWLWALLAGTLALACRTRVMRTLNCVFVVLSLVFVWAVPVPWQAATMLTVIVALGWSLRRRIARSFHWWCPALGLCLYLTEFSARAAVGRVVRSELRSEPSLHEIDLVRSPVPATPWCWEVVHVLRDESSSEPTYLVRIGRAGLLALMGGPKGCPESRLGFTARVAPVDSEHGSVIWEYEYRRPLSEMAATRSDCRFAALLRFARVPYYDPETGWAGDLRYDRTRGEDFSDLLLPAIRSCPKWVPPWQPPRADSF
jgi:inner membrane protein